jgi:PST family polysaccharide transporter
MSRSRPTFRVAVAWSFVLAGGKQGIMLVLTFVLAAILGPRDFGTVAMAMGYLMIAEMLLELGLVPALMQRENLRDEHLDSAFWAVLIWSLVLMAISAGSAPFWADANDYPELARVIQVLSITLPIDALTLVQRTWLQRHMDFRSLAVRSNVAVLTAGAVSLTLALLGFGVWALVWQRLTIGIVSVSLLWWISPWRPKLRFDKTAARELMSFSFGAMLSRIANFVTNRMDALVMGFFFGPVAVGIYQLGYRLVNVVLEVTSRAILPVALAEFSRLQSKPAALRNAVAACGRLSASLSIPVFAVLALSSRELLALLGDDWAPAVYPTALLCVTGMARAATIVTGPLLRAVGRPYLDAALSWAFAIPTLASIVVVAWMVSDQQPTQQAVAIAASRAVLYGAIIFPVCSVVIWRAVPQAPLLRPFGPSVAASLVGVAFVQLVHRVGFAPENPTLWTGLFEAAATAAVVGGTLLLLDADLRQTLQRFRLKAASRFAPAPAAAAGTDESSDV